jgi:hypothetical protein
MPISVFCTSKLRSGQDHVFQWFDIEYEQVLQMAEQRARDVHIVKGGNGSHTPA